MWAYDVDTDTWEERSSQTPGIGTYHGIAYDAESDRVVVFGGGSGSSAGATLAYDYNADTWTDLSSDTSPTDRVYQAMAYDPATDRIIMFGGVQGAAETPTDETWAYDLDSNTWSLLSPTSRPGARAWSALAFNRVTARSCSSGADPAGRRPRTKPGSSTPPPMTGLWRGRDIALRPGRYARRRVASPSASATAWRLVDGPSGRLPAEAREKVS